MGWPSKRAAPLASPVHGSSVTRNGEGCAAAINPTRSVTDGAISLRIEPGSAGRCAEAVGSDGVQEVLAVTARLPALPGGSPR